MYTWGTGTLAMDGDYVKFTVGTDSAPADIGRITFDTSPKSYYMSYDKPYFVVVMKAEKAFSGYISFTTLSGEYRKEFPVEFSGEWQKIILDFSEKNGWTKKNENGEYEYFYGTPFSAEINALYGGHAMRLPGTKSSAYYHFDYMAMFATLEEAEAFEGLANVTSTVTPSSGAQTIKAAVSRSPLTFMSGYEDGTFRPNNGMTRAEACTVIARLLATEEDIAGESLSTAFTDISLSDWYYKYITYLEKRGMLNAFTGDFKPDSPITRAEFVKIAYEADAFESSGNTTVTFSDVNENVKFADEIYAAAGSKAINGYEDGTFRPKKTITRAEITAILCRILDVKGNSELRQKFSDLDRAHWAYGQIMEIITPKTLTVNSEEAIAKITEVDALAEKRKQEILSTKTEVTVKGTSYYVSSSGDDSNDGKSPETAWKTTAKASSAALNPGDGVFFRRGDTFRGQLIVRSGITYSAYGEGAKPNIYASPENGAVAENWELVDKANNIWRYKRKMNDQGTLVFNEGEKWAIKQIPSFKGGSFVNAAGEKYNPVAELKENLWMFCETTENLTSNGVPSPMNSIGYLYLRCDEGNPGEVFDSIEFMPREENLKSPQDAYYLNDTLIDNLCIKYGGSMGVHTNNGDNYTVQNCVFGWIGGCVQSYTFYADNPGKPVRFGNAVELGYANGHTVKSCYVYQIYDAGLSFQTGRKADDKCIINVTYEDNLIENCTYLIECFWGEPKTEGFDKYAENFVIRNNIMRFAGYGFGSQRPDVTNATFIRTGQPSETIWNKVKDRSFIIEGNILDRSAHRMLTIGCRNPQWTDNLPIIRNNTFIQHRSTDANTSVFGFYSYENKIYKFGEDILFTFKALGIDDDDNVYIVD